MKEYGTRVLGAEVRRFSSDRRGLALNVFLGIAGGGLGTLSEALILPNLVLAFLVGQLTDSYTVVGLVPAVGIGLWSLARLPATIHVGPQRRRLPWAVGAALVRAATMALLALVCFRYREGAEAQLLRAFFICYVAYSLAAGFASVPTEAVVAKAIPHEGRAMFYRQRGLWGGVMGVIAGLVVAQLLAAAGPVFAPYYARLFLAATVCQTATAFFIATLREPIRLPVARSTAFATTLRAVPQALADSNLRRFLAFRLALSLSTVIDPFLVIFAAARLGVPAAAVGGYVVALIAGRLVSAPLWAALARRQGEKAVLQVAALARLVAPLLALLLPFLTRTDLYRERVDDPRVLAALFGLAFVAIGVATGGQARGNFGYLAEIAPPQLRGAYAGLTNALLTGVAFAPIAGGLILDRSGYDALFLAATVIGLVAIFASGALTDTHVRTRPTTHAWRLRRPPPRRPGEDDPRPRGGLSRV